ncbi:MAG: phosphotransferase [Lysobacterales bacterium]
MKAGEEIAVLDGGELLSQLERLLGSGLSFRQLPGGSDGLSFVVERGRRGRVALRLWHNRTIKDVVRENSVLRLLENVGVKAPSPYFEYFTLSDGRVAALRLFIVGESVDELRTEEIDEVARSLAVLHGSSLPEHFDDSGHMWPRAWEIGFLDELERISPDLAGRCRRVREDITQLRVEQLSKSIIHDDVSLANILRTDSGCCIIDWSDAHIDLSIADLAAALTQLNLGSSAKRRFVDVYKETRMDNCELESLSTFVERRGLFMEFYRIKASISDPTRSKAWTEI